MHDGPGNSDPGTHPRPAWDPLQGEVDLGSESRRYLLAVTRSVTADRGAAVGRGVPARVWPLPNDGIDQNCDGKDLIVGSGVIQVTLMWDNDNDMDLHVHEPDATHIWYADPGPTATGGRLDRDDNVFVCGSDPEPGGVENVYWPDTASPQRGTYRVNVVEYNRCAEPSNLIVEVRIDGQLLVSRTATGTDSFTCTY